MNRILALLLAGTVTGCTCGTQNPGTPDPANPADPNDPKLTRDANGCFTQLTSLALTPADETKDLASGDTVTFTATGTLADGSTANLTELLTWKAARADDTPPGEVVKGAFQPPAGGGYTISATDGCKTGQTALTVKMSSTFQQPAQATVDRFAGPVVTGTAAVPTLVYPNDQTRFPRNIYKVLFQWKKGSHDQFRLTFTGPVLDHGRLHRRRERDLRGARRGRLLGGRREHLERDRRRERGRDHRGLARRRRLG